MAKTSPNLGPLSLIPTPGGQTGGTDQFTEFASHMALVHNIIIRGYNSIYLQAPKVKQADVHDFLHYCQAWNEFVVGHHDSEEHVLFPGTEKETGVQGIMDEDVQEHASFHHGLADIKAYLETSLTSPASDFNGSNLIMILDCFAPAFHSHLTHEPARLASLSRYDFDMKALGDHTTQHSLQRYSTTDILPVLWYNLDTTFENGKWESFPELPAAMKWYMINVLGWWRRSWWRFVSCGANGVERELLCLRDDY
ncbi:hypothetical protein UA08_00145 [Talaromyces atroroseus]|uniref:Hemerythrin-like domain-containing protein n=1 Tax=Talaromyces atroroseus TaxID=1441469 RepID=A0A225BDM2_TALAT|nr:hypothetical protein UA08_00145 [Talaromyces atroroseus]OKL64117.1 hypothetical protein UA08_00145 [Talaromyces atroroseus]